ncbi:MAG: DUF5719 family protein [Propionibacteriaceae bacterium]|nr:DUF5719 family protein [Propionibacteriaceae bacterium]
MGRIVQTLGGFVVLSALLFAVTLLTPAELPRVTTVETTRSAKVVCIPTEEGGDVHVTGTNTVGTLGEAPEPGQRVVLTGQNSPVVAEGTAGPVGGALSGSGAVRTLTPCIRPVSRGVISLPATANTVLRIVNPDASEAAIDLTLLGPDGEIQALGARGIALGPNGEKTIALSVLTSEATPVGVSFQASRGRAAVVAFTTTSTSGTAAIPAEAATTHWLPGVMADVPEASVVLANPGHDRATVRLTAYGTTPAYTPDGGDSVTIAGHSTVVVPLQGALAGEAAALRVDSDVEVLAGLAVAQGDGAQVSPVRAGAELVSFVAPGGTLQLTNPGAEPVTASLVVDDGEVGTVEVGAGMTVAQALPETTDAAQSVTVRASSEMFGAVVATGEAGTWVAPLQPAGSGDAAPVEAELDPGLR